MDIWEANLDAAAFTPHPCKVDGQTRCDGKDCGNGDDRYSGMCDKGERQLLFFFFSLLFLSFLSLSYFSSYIGTQKLC
jgi:hypothetical protein